MGIAEINNKTSLIKSNVPKVYEAGQITGGGGGVDYDEAYNDGYQAGYIDGQESVPNILEHATKLNDMYNKAVFPSDFELNLNIPLVDSIRYAFIKTNIKKVILKGNNNGYAIDAYSAFQESSVKTIDLTEYNAKIDKGTMMFFSATSLQEILGELDFTECTSTASMFNYCNELVTIKVKANSIKLSISFAQSSKLSATSIQSIIDGLATVETAQTVTFHSSIVLTDEQKATISSKGWTLAQ